MTKDTETIQTWGKKVRYLGAAHSGTGAARLMHLSSIALMPLAIAFVWILVRLSRLDYGAARAEFGKTCPALLVLLFTGAAIWHMKVGMQSIIDDYVHDHHVKEAALILNLFFAIVVGVCCVFAILKMCLAAV